jgi:hypothetical protein
VTKAVDKTSFRDIRLGQLATKLKVSVFIGDSAGYSSGIAESLKTRSESLNPPDETLVERERIEKEQTKKEANQPTMHEEETGCSLPAEEDKEPAKEGNGNERR